MGTALFIVEPTGRCRLVLRRFRVRDHGRLLTELGPHYHDASLVIDDDAETTPRDGDDRRQRDDDRIARDDPRWPAACTCGEQFTDDDEWQVNELEWYEGGGHRFAWGIGSWDGQPGAMMRSPWMDRDGRPPAWVVFLPNGHSWNTNDRAAAAGPGNEIGPYWDVAGEPPKITVGPSIWDKTPGREWHGWIRNGELIPA